MKLMRHSDIKLTVKDYSDEEQMELREALGMLPVLGAPRACASPPASPTLASDPDLTPESANSRPGTS